MTQQVKPLQVTPEQAEALKRTIAALEEIEAAISQAQAVGLTVRKSPDRVTVTLHGVSVLMVGDYLPES